MKIKTILNFCKIRVKSKCDWTLGFCEMKKPVSFDVYYDFVEDKHFIANTIIIRTREFVTLVCGKV